MHNLGFHSDYETMESRIVELATRYVKSAGVKSLVIGLSGGVDSTVVCALGRKVCDQLGTKLIGVSLPTDFNKYSEKRNAVVTGEAFCDKFTIHDITDSAHKLIEDMTDRLRRTVAKDGVADEATLHDLKVRRGNAAARLRMIFLYDTAKANRGLVLSTDNFTELLLGFWTLHGDVGDFGMLQNLWKTEVYGLASHMYVDYIAKNYQYRAEALFQSSRAVPTDGLGVTESDMDQIGAKDYEEVDKILLGFLNGDTTKLSHKVIQRHLTTAFKRENPYNLRREDIIT